jgi:hypothetical protein
MGHGIRAEMVYGIALQGNLDLNSRRNLAMYSKPNAKNKL